MTDIVDPARRSKMMASIRGKNTRPELLVRRGLHRLGFRFRLHRRDLPGRPDLVFPKYRAVLFVHGCFWHRHAACKLAYTPSANAHVWVEKFNTTIERDRRQIGLLLKAGWRVFVIWECSLRGNDLNDLFMAVAAELKAGHSTYREWSGGAGRS